MPEVFVGKKEQTEELTEAVYSTLIADASHYETES